MNRYFATVLLAVLAVSQNASASSVADIVGKMQAQSVAEGRGLLVELIKLGPAALKEVCAGVGEMGKKEDAKFRFALHGAARHAMRPGADDERKMIEGVLLEALAGAQSDEIKAFFVEQLNVVATNTSVAPLSALLADEKLCDPATMALLTVKSPEAIAALAKALPEAKGKNLITLVRALGEVREKSVAKTILSHASSDDAVLRQTAWFALANIGDASATDVLAKAAESKAGYEKSVATANYILLARRLGEAGERDACVKICRSLMETRTSPKDSNVYIAALSTLTGALGKGAVPDLLTAIDSKDLKISVAAIQQLEGIEGIDLVAQLTPKMKTIAPESRATVVRLFGKRAEKASLPLVKEALLSEEVAVRTAAIYAIATVGGAEAIEPLIGVLEQNKPEETAAAKTALMTINSDNFTAAIAAAYGKASPAAKPKLLELLGARGATDQLKVVLEATNDKDANISGAALRALSSVVGAQDAPKMLEMLLATGTQTGQGSGPSPASAGSRGELFKAALAACRKSSDPSAPILAVLPSSTGENRADLFKMLSRLGGENALKAVVAESQSSDAAAREAAIRCLSDWADVGAAPALLTISREAKEPVHHVLALRGYLRMITLPNSRTPDQTVQMLKEAMDSTKTPDDKKLVLGGLSGVRQPGAALIAATCLDVEPIKAETAATVIAMICPTNDKPGLQGAGLADALKKASTLATNEALKKKASEYLPKLETAGRSSAAPVQKEPKAEAAPNKPEPAAAKPPTPLPAPDADGFITLFNGKDLTHWMGAVDGYGVENGILYCDPKKGGNLLTEHQFGDFILKFEFKLPPGANNGLGIRTPAKGDAAYVGMELQILDDGADQYKTLKPFQYHGSVYGLVAAKRGHQKPVGEWNEEEVHIIGSKVKVILNGTVITDCDLREVAKTAPAEDVKKHPGMFRRAGHIGWLGHGAKVEFKNIRIKPLDNAYTAGPHNVPPEGYTALFNGKDLTGWKGLVADPIKRAKMTKEELAEAEKKATEKALEHWKVVDGIIEYDGKNNSLCTVKDYGDFEMLVDWKIGPRGDSGIYIRGSPQVQIWDPAMWPVGSGGLYNNKQNPSNPSKCSDYPIGQWNRMKIKMVGEKVWVWLNEELVVDNVTLENYWDRNQPIFPTGQIELQHHGDHLWFRNIYIKELPKQ